MSEYPASITKALHEIMTKVGYVQKKDRNDFHKYKYAGEAALLEALRPAMVEAGLLLLPSGVEQSSVDQYGNTQISVSYTLAHKGGDVWPDKLIAFGCGNDKNKTGGVGDKGTYKALTGANKYLLFKLFQIETGDDPERAEHDPPNLPPEDLTPTSDQRMADNIDAYAKNAKSVAIANLKERAKGMSSDLSSVAEESELAGFLTGYAGLMNELKKELPDWHKAALDAVEGKRESFKQIASGGAG